jgi:hypothetical protein
LNGLRSNLEGGVVPGAQRLDGEKVESRGIMMREKKKDSEWVQIVSECGHQNMAGPRVKPGVLEFWCTDCGYLAQCAVSGNTPEAGEKLEGPKQDQDEK